MLRPQVFEIFKEVDHILHGGDVGRSDLLIELGTVAPVTAVYGNTDGFDLRSREVIVPEHDPVAIGDHYLLIVDERHVTGIGQAARADVIAPARSR